MKRVLLFVSTLLFFLSACSGPGSTVPEPQPEPQPVPPATVAITSHSNGETIIGDRAIVIEANVTNPHENVEVTVQLNGTAVPFTVAGETIAATVTLKDNENEVTVTANNPEQDVPAAASVTLTYPFITLENLQAASVVIGQPDFESDNESAPDKYFYSIYGNPLIANGMLYLPDYGANRVLGYHSVPTENGAAADFVLGKADFNDNTSEASASTFSGPQTVVTDGDKLYVVDYSDNRILVYNSLPTTSGAAADHVIGQPDFTTTGSNCTATGLDSPESLVVVDGKLIVADGGNNRVLIWNAVPSVIDTPADIVLGQNAMDSCAYNDDNQDGSPDANPTARTFDSPTDVWSDGERLVVADADNSRVLIWNTFPTTNFVPADVVLGQPDFVSDDDGTSASSFIYPYMLHSNGNQLFVADALNHRVLIWNAFPTEHGQPADVVLGQPDMNTDDPNLGGGPSASGLYRPDGVHAAANQLVVGDYRNDRFLIFTGLNP